MKNLRLLQHPKKGFLVVFFATVFMFGFSNQADAKFWGKEEDVLFQTEDPAGNCIEYYVESRYILWIKVSESGAQERPC